MNSELLRQVVGLATAAGTLVGMWAAGSKKTWAWLVGLGNQVLWFAFIVLFGAWSLLPLTCALVVIYTRNYLKWRREATAELTETLRQAFGPVCTETGIGEGCPVHGTAIECSDPLIRDMVDSLTAPIVDKHAPARIIPNVVDPDNPAGTLYLPHPREEQP